jgi:hypothetical protein
MSYHAVARRTALRIFALLGVITTGASAQTLSTIGNSKGAQTLEQSQWMAQPFVTGSNSAGYTLTSVSLVLDVAKLPASGGGDDGPTGGPLYVSIYSSSGSGVGGPLTDGLLMGSLNPSSGNDTWTPASGSTVVLAPSTEYWLVATTSATATEYAWGIALNQETEGDIGWSIPGGYDVSNNQGGTWSATPNDTLFSLGAAEVTAAPEPQTWTCLLLALGALGFFKRVRRARSQK